MATTSVGASSLDLIGGSVDDDRPVICPKSVDWYWLNRATGAVAPGRCKAATCEVCGPFEARIRARIISDGGATGPPQRFLVMTTPPEQWAMEWSRLRQKMRDFKRLNVKRHGEWEQAWTVERGKKHGMLHVNVLQKGARVDQHELQDTWGGIVRVRRIRGAIGASSYALKEAGTVVGYSTKEARANMDQHLALNGGRILHLSRSYLGGERMADVRARLTKDPEAQPGEWVRVFEGASV